MGVRGLKTYLERYCPDACYQVDISKLVSNRRKSGKRAEIVVDGQSCFSMWYQGLDWTIGIEVQELIYRLQSFVLSFQNIDAELVFFIGGLTPEKKRKTWLRRRVANMHKMMNVFDMLNKGRLYSDIPEEWDYIPPNMTNFVAYVLKYMLNCTVYVTVDECDEEIIQYVADNDSFAIFSSDTDFIVSYVDCFVLSAEDFDLSQMTTWLYDSCELCQYLDIEEGQLPLLAILAGNDYIDYETLKPFHFKQCNRSSRNNHIPYNILFSSLAKYINLLPHPDDVSTEELMEMVCNDVFDSSDKADEMELAFNSYFPNYSSDEPDSGSYSESESEPDTPWSRVLTVAEERLRNILLPVSAWGVLSRQIYESSVCLEDFRDINDDNENPEEVPSATVTRTLRQRLYGILLYEIRHSNPTVTEWCGENEESYQRPVSVNPEYTRAHHPGMRALWDENRSDIHYRHKWILFLKAISPDIYNIGAWMSLPLDLVISTAACYYLYMEEDFLDDWELDAVLATLALYPSYDRDCLDRIYDGSYVNLRAIQISVTFSRTFSLVFSLFASCGYPIPLTKDTSFMKFEPKLFQHIYRKENSGATVKELCDYDRNKNLFLMLDLEPYARRILRYWSVLKHNYPIGYNDPLLTIASDWLSNA